MRVIPTLHLPIFQVDVTVPGSGKRTVIPYRDIPLNITECGGKDITLNITLCVVGGLGTLRLGGLGTIGVTGKLWCF